MAGVPPPPAWAAAYIGVPFVERGRSRAGADCWYFVHLVLAERFGVHVPTYDGIGFVDGDDRRVLAEVMAARKQDWRRIPEAEVRPGDVVLIRMGGAPIHVGVVCGVPWMLHCERGTGSALSNYQVRPWRFPRLGGSPVDRIEGFYRHVSARPA